jgi:hypothetical protein
MVRIGSQKTYLSVRDVGADAADDIGGLLDVLPGLAYLRALVYFYIEFDSLDASTAQRSAQRLSRALPRLSQQCIHVRT